MHEESAMNIANGYYAVEGKPMAMITFAPPGIMHASMGIYGAFCGHTPTFVMCATFLDATQRRPTLDWGEHASLGSCSDGSRDFTGWDDARP